MEFKEMFGLQSVQIMFQAWRRAPADYYKFINSEKFNQLSLEDQEQWKNEKQDILNYIAKLESGIIDNSDYKYLNQVHFHEDYIKRQGDTYPEIVQFHEECIKELRKVKDGIQS